MLVGMREKEGGLERQMGGDGGWRWLLKMYIHTNIGYIYAGLNKGLIKGMAKSSNFFLFWMEN